MKLKIAITSEVLYKSYCEKCKIKKTKPITYKRFHTIISSIGMVYRSHFLELGIIGLPHGLGDVFLKNFTRNSRRTFFEDGKGKVEPSIFDESGGAVKTIYWYHRDKKKRRGADWKFYPHTDFRKDVSKKLFAKKVYPDYAKMLGIK